MDFHCAGPRRRHHLLKTGSAAITLHQKNGGTIGDGSTPPRFVTASLSVDFMKPTPQDVGDGPPSFRRDFTCPAVLRIHSRGNEVSTTGLLPSLTSLSRLLRLPRSFVTPYRVSYNPKRQASWFGLIPFRSPLLRESREQPVQK